MKKGILLAVVLMLTACSGNGDKRYYQLPAAADSATTPSLSPNATGRHLWLARVNVSDFLAGNGVVYQTSDVEYVTASNNLWASPLEQQLQQTLAANLTNALPGALVSSSQVAGNQDTLVVNVTGFQGRYDGQVVIRGEWLLTHNDVITRFPINVTLKQGQDGYDAMVRTLAQGWLQVSQNIARQLSIVR